MAVVNRMIIVIVLYLLYIFEITYVESTLQLVGMDICSNTETSVSWQVIQLKIDADPIALLHRFGY